MNTYTLKDILADIGVKPLGNIEGRDITNPMIFDSIIEEYLPTGYKNPNKTKPKTKEWWEE